MTERLRSVLEKAGLRAAVLKSDTVKPEARETWVRQQVEQGKDVLIAHPRLVSEGLDLLWFPTLVWAQIDASVFTLRQASRRSWRIGQRQPVRVHFLVYGGTLQAKLLHLVATKLQASLAVEGDLPEDGLAAEEADDDVFLALARQAVADADAHDGGLEAMFAEAAAGAANNALLLADDDQEQPPVVPETQVVEEQPETATVLSLDDFRRGMGLSDSAVRRPVRRVAVPKEQLSLFG